MSESAEVDQLVENIRREYRLIVDLDQQSRAAKKRRRLLMWKLAQAGWTERRIGEVAGITGPGVHAALVKARDEAGRP